MNDRVSPIVTTVSALREQPVVYLHVAVFLPPSPARGQTQPRVISDAHWRLVNFQGQESISDHFEYELELHGNSAEHGEDIVFHEVLGCPVSVGLHYAALNDYGEQPTREESGQWFSAALQQQDEPARLVPFNGVVAAFSVEQPGVYRITMRPALWKLTLTNAYRIYTQLTVREVLEKLLRQHGVAFSLDGLDGKDNLALTRRQDWLQAGETDYDFMRRLMSKAHIYYFYVSSTTQHIVTFANRPAYPPALPSGQALRYCYTGADELGLAQADVISEYRLQQSLGSSAVCSVLTREEAAWESDAVAGHQNFYANSKAVPGELPFHQYLIYQYGGSHSEVDHYAQATQDTLDASNVQFSGASYCPWLRAGYHFSVTQFPRSGQMPLQVRPELEGRAFVATQVQHQATLDGGYTNKFQAVYSTGLVTPFSIQETQQGSVLAVVVAHDGEAAPIGWRYYEKDKFFPAQQLISDSLSHPPGLLAQGVYVRFSSASEDSAPVWVKLAAHMQTVPEIGVSVMVTRAQDQSELPEIQSIIQANGSKVIMPSGWTANTNVGSSYSTGYGDGKSIRFGLKSAANLDHAVAIINQQYDDGQFRESSYSQGASYSYATSENGKNGILSKSDSFGSTYSEHHGAESQGLTVFDNTVNISTVKEKQKSESEVAEADNKTITGKQTNTSLTGESHSTEMVGVQMSTSATLSATSASMTGMRVNASLEGVSNNTSLTGISASQSLVGLSSQISATGSSDSVSVTGASTHVALTGVDTGTNLVGANTSVSLTGSSTTTSLVGQQTEVSVTGVSNRVNVVGQSTTVSVTGDSMDISMSGDSTSVAIKGSTLDVVDTASSLSLHITASSLVLEVPGLKLEIQDLSMYL